ncbi:MAG TPA: hypothetical protein OIM20_07665 [Eggerthellaceae bacterium]|nr:hypothetical protein [Eggerthellaceae bacterium]
MPSRCKYISSNGATIELDSRPTLIGTAEGLRINEWSYSLGYRNISAVTRDAKEATISAFFKDQSVADELRHAADYDISVSEPGRIVIDDWWQRAYIVKSEPNSINRFSHKEELTVILLDGVWRKPKEIEFYKDADVSSEYLDLPYDLEYDLLIPPPKQYVEVSKWSKSLVGLVIYGPATSPSISIAGNSYIIDIVVPTGAYLTVDPIKKEVILTDINGSKTSVFDKAVRGSGIDGGMYIFQPLPAGEWEVVWDKSFGFRFIGYEEDGGIPWM